MRVYRCTWRYKRFSLPTCTCTTAEGYIRGTPFACTLQVFKIIIIIIVIYVCFITVSNPLVSYLCSAGVGRTGVFILTEISVGTFQDGHDVDLAIILSKVRQQRMSLVQTEVCFCFNTYTNAITTTLFLSIIYIYIYILYSSICIF